MNDQKIKFKISKVERNDNKLSKNLLLTTEYIQNSLANFKYTGTLQTNNSKQLDIHFDKEFCKLLKISEDDICPLLDSQKLKDKNYIDARQKADLIFYHENTPNFPVVIEIEKANKKTIWYDFIKLWMFIESGQAKAGILICPINYAHRNGVWNLFDEACKNMNYLKRIAEVPTKKIDKISIIGYRQEVNIDGKFVEWNEMSFKIIKGIKN